VVVRLPSVLLLPSVELDPAGPVPAVGLVVDRLEFAEGVMPGVGVVVPEPVVPVEGNVVPIAVEPVPHGVVLALPGVALVPGEAPVVPGDAPVVPGDAPVVPGEAPVVPMPPPLVEGEEAVPALLPPADPPPAPAAKARPALVAIASAARDGRRIRCLGMSRSFSFLRLAPQRQRNANGEVPATMMKLPGPSW
jgi:hypothetical protein